MGHTWPRPGIPIVPRSLRVAWGTEVIPLSIASRAGLPPTAKIADLDNTVWDLSENPKGVSVLSKYVAELVNSRIYYGSGGGVTNTPVLAGHFREDADTKRIPYSVRTLNALIAARRLEDKAWLENVTFGDFLALRNAGVVTLLDFATTSEEFLVPPTDETNNNGVPLTIRDELLPELECMARDFPLTEISSQDPRLAHLGLGAETVDVDLRRLLSPAKLDRVEAKRTLLEVRAALESMARQKLDDALMQIIAGIGISEKNGSAVAARLGWDGNGGTTLSVAAESVGLSRERIRQLQRKLSKFCGRISYLPALDRAINILEESALTLERSVHRRLVGEDVTSRPFLPHGVVTAAHVFGRTTSFSVSSDGRSVESDDAKEQEPLRSALASLTDVNHVAPIAEIQARCLAQSGREPSEDLVRGFLARQERVVWLTPDNEWIWDGRSCRYVNFARKILSVLGEVSFEKLREGVLRDSHTRNMSLPREVFRSLCRAAGFQISGDSVRLAEHEPKVELGSVEQTLVDVLVEHEGVMAVSDLREECLHRGVNRHSFWVFLVYSPVLERVSTGVYCLRGADLDPSKVSAVGGSITRGPSSLEDHGWTKDGGVWAGFRVNPTLLDQGQVFFKKAIVDVIGARRLELYSVDGTRMGTIVVSATGNSWGLGPFITRRGVEEGDLIIISVDTELEVACALSGSDELLLSYQDGDGWGPRRYLEEATRPQMGDLHGTVGNSA